MEPALLRKREAWLAPWRDERRLRLYGRAEALALGYGGTAVVSQATGGSRPPITGCQERLAAGQSLPLPAAAGRLRTPGGGRKRPVAAEATLRADLERLLDPVPRGDPASPWRGTSTRVRTLADARHRSGHPTRHRLVAAVLQERGARRQANRKTLEGRSQPDRAAPFEPIHQTVKAFHTADHPVLAVATNTQAWGGACKTPGRERRPKGAPESVRVQEFELPAWGQVAPSGVDDQTPPRGWVQVGTDQDTASLAVASLRRWWHTRGPPVYPNAQRLLMTADSGGRHGDRTRRWTTAGQKVAHETGRETSVCPLPPGTSTWTKMAPRRFSSLSQHGRGQPLVSHAVRGHLMAAPTPHPGLTVRWELDTNPDPKGIRLTDKDLPQVNRTRDQCHGEWNDTIKPHAS
jgi:hypothetical protein